MAQTWEVPVRLLRAVRSVPQGRLKIRNSGINSFAPAMSVFAAVLVMFGMTLPQPHHGVSIWLPKASWPVYLPQATREDAIIVTITRDGAVFLGRDRTEPEQIASAIHKDVERGSERKVYIRADARTMYRSVKQVLDAVHESGLVDVSFMVGQSAGS